MDRAKQLHADVMSVVEVLMVGDPAPETTEGKILVALAGALEKYEKSSTRPELQTINAASQARTGENPLVGQADRLSNAGSPATAAPSEGPTPTDVLYDRLSVMEPRRALLKMYDHARQLEREATHLMMQIGYLAALVSKHTGGEIPAIVDEARDRTAVQ